MKRSIALLIICAVFIIRGCGNGGSETVSSSADATTNSTNSSEAETTTDNTMSADVGNEAVDYKQYVVLGNYKGMELTAIDTSVTDEELQAELDFMFRIDVRDGDDINLDFTGYVDGKTFEGGSTEGEGYDLSIGSDTFIDGFEEGLIGSKVGETVYLNLKFPDNYAEDLAGKDVVFECTINEIYYTAGVAELTEEYVTQNTEYKTVAEYKEAVRAELVAYREEQAESMRYSELYEKLFGGCEIKEYPEALFNKCMEDAKEYYDSMIAYYHQMYCMYYETAFTEEQVLTMMKITREDIDKDIKETAQETAKSIMVMTAIAEAEGITLSDAEFEEALLSLVEQMGAMSKEEFYEQTGYTEENLRQDCLFDKVLEFLMDNAVFK